MKTNPRVYQELAVKVAVPALLSSSRRALVVLATGLGKTFTAALIAKKMKAKCILFLVHNNFILKHAIDEFCLVCDSKKTKMAIYNGMSKNGARDADIVFASWQTMGGNLKQWAKNHFDLIIVDEAHHTEAYTYRPVADYFKGAKLGITATPDRADKADIRDVFGPEVINVTLEEAVARGWLPRIEYHVITDESLDENELQKIAAEIKEGKKRFTMAEVNRRIFIKKRDHEIAKIINGYTEKTVVFCASIAHAERMVKSLDLASTFHSSKGISQSDTYEKNQKTLDALKNGLVRRVCAVNAFNEGVNVPSIGLVAFCRVTGVITVFRQQLGRGLRPGKDKLIVLDFVGNIERIRLVMAMMNKISDIHEEYTPCGEIEREGYIRQKFEVSGKGFEFTFSDKVVDLMEILEHCERDVYPTWQEASKAAKSRGIKTKEEYVAHYKEDERLPSDPYSTYKNFPAWGVFTGTGSLKGLYPTWQESSIAAKRLGIKSSYQYRIHRRKDIRLPSGPHLTYKSFPGWQKFLGKESRYKTWQEAAMAAIKLGITSKIEYKTKRIGDEKLPGDPFDFYPDFPNWYVFLTGQNRVKPYQNLNQAQSAARKLGIMRQSDYVKRHNEDPRLPSSPRTLYANFPSWKKFLGRK